MGVDEGADVGARNVEDTIIAVAVILEDVMAPNNKLVDNATTKRRG